MFSVHVYIRKGALYVLSVILNEGEQDSWEKV